MGNHAQPVNCRFLEDCRFEHLRFQRRSRVGDGVVVWSTGDAPVYVAERSGVLLLCSSCASRVFLVCSPGLWPCPAALLHRRGTGRAGNESAGAEHSALVFRTVDLLPSAAEDLRAWQARGISSHGASSTP